MYVRRYFSAEILFVSAIVAFILLNRCALSLAQQNIKCGPKGANLHGIRARKRALSVSIPLCAYAVDGATNNRHSVHNWNRLREEWRLERLCEGAAPHLRAHSGANGNERGGGGKAEKAKAQRGKPKPILISNVRLKARAMVNGIHGTATPNPGEGCEIRKKRPKEEKNPNRFGQQRRRVCGGTRAHRWKLKGK